MAANPQVQFDDDLALDVVIALTYDSNGSNTATAVVGTFATLPTGLSAQMSASLFSVT